MFRAFQGYIHLSLISLGGPMVQPPSVVPEATVEEPSNLALTVWVAFTISAIQFGAWPTDSGLLQGRYSSVTRRSIIIP